MIAAGGIFLIVVFCVVVTPQAPPSCVDYPALVLPQAAEHAQWPERGINLVDLLHQIAKVGNQQHPRTTPKNQKCLFMKSFQLCPHLLFVVRRAGSA